METNENYHRQHQDLRTEDGIAYGDVIEGVDFDYVTKLTALTAVSLAGMASAPPPPADVALEGAVTAQTTLKWTRPPASHAPNLAGYTLYWLLTSERPWTHGGYCGAVGNSTSGRQESKK